MERPQLCPVATRKFVSDISRNLEIHGRLILLLRFTQAWRWSKAIDLYLSGDFERFLSELKSYGQNYKLTDYEKTVAANAKVLVGRNEEAKRDFLQLSSEINPKSSAYLNLYCRASVADLDNNNEEYLRLSVLARQHRSKRFDRTLPLRA